MEVNPEFRRNIWLELSLHRLVAMPAVLLLVLALVYASSTDKVEAMAGAAALIAAGLLGIWGTRCAADCVMEEARARTWDGQRMSGIGPWAMTWGKLLGSASFAWYGGLMALAVLLLASPRGWAHSPAKVVALIVAGSLLAHGVACFAGLVAVRKGLARPGGFSAVMVVVLIVFIGPLVSLASSHDQLPVNWWGSSWQAMNFVLASAAFFAAWAVFGVYRVMCSELQVRTVPWVFVVFALFLTLYLSGFWIAVAATGNVVLLCGLLVAGALTYIQLFSEQSGVIAFRRVGLRVGRGEIRRALEDLPCWPVGLALAALWCVLALVFLDPSALPGAADRNLRLIPLPLFLLLARDAAILLIFAFAWQPRRVEAAVFFYLVLLYGVVPGLLKAAGMGMVADLVLPPVLEAPGKATAVAAAQLAIAVVLVQWRLRAYGRREAQA